MKAYRNEFRLNDEKYVVVTVNQNEEETTVVTKKVVDKVHHVLILDRSGSMTRDINKLMDQVQESINAIRKQDLISILWFSSVGQYKVVVKGAKKDDDLKALVDTMRSTIHLTCFSEVVHEAGVVIKDLEKVCHNASVTLFTDGQPCLNEWSVEQELIKTKLSVAEMKEHILAFNTIGYGHYCNERFLHELSKISTFGCFTHSDNIEEFKHIFKFNFNKIEKTMVESVNIKHDDSIVYLTRNTTKMESNTMNIDFIDAEKNQFFLIATKDFTFNYNGKEIDSRDLTNESNDVTMMNFFYAWAYNNYIEGNKALSTDIIGKKIFDKKLVDLSNAAFNNSEREEVRREIENALFNPSARFADGKCANNYLPNPKAHCVMDILMELSNSCGYYVANHKDGEKYNRIGSKVEDTTDNFIYDSGIQYASMEDFIYNQKRANISIKVPMKGSVRLSSEDSLKVGTACVECIDFKTYNIVKDGNLNMSSMVVLIPDLVIESLHAKKTKLEELKIDKAILKELKDKHGFNFLCVRVYLEGKPMINKLYLDQSFDLKYAFELEEDTVRLEASQKVLNYYIKELYADNTTAEKEGVFKKYTIDQIAVFKKYGITSEGWYHAPANKVVKTGDVLTFREMDFVFKGMSGLPSMKDLLAGNKTETVAGKVMLEAFEELKQNLAADGLSLIDKNFKTRDRLNELLVQCKKALKVLRHNSTMMKIAKVLNGDWFTGLKVDAKGINYFEHKGKTLYLKNTYKTEVI